MAKFNVVGLDDVQEAMLRRDKATMEAVPEMLKAGGEVIKNAFQAETKKLNSTGRGTGDLTASIKVSAVKERNGGKYVYIAPTGKDRHGVRNAEKCAAFGRKSKMNVDSTLKALLDKLGVPVARLKYNGRAACFITYQLVVGRDTLFSDDEEGAQEYTYQINIYSKTDYFALLQRLKTALKAAGFYGITINAEVYEQDTGYYHVPVEIKYMEV